MKYAVLFPGQGSQFVGMGDDVLAARPDLLGDTAERILGWSLADLITSGPEDALTSTDKAQPALYAVSCALWEAFASYVAEPPLAAAGHSVGEYAALTAAGSIPFEVGLAVVAKRGAAMAAAGRETGGAMVALLGNSPEDADRIAETRREAGGQLWVANYNSPGQVVLAGAIEDIEWVKESARDLGIRRVIELKVSGAFHTPLVEPAADALASALADVDFAEPAFPIYSNVTAAPMEEPATTLTRQLVAPVRFAESLQAMVAAGVETFVHIGPGNVTAGLAARNAPEAMTHVVQSLSEAEDVASALSVE